MTIKVIYNDQVIAESDEGRNLLENNYYFKPSELNMEYFSKSANDTHTTCPFKGEASYYDITVGDNTIRDAAWYYPNITKEDKKHIEGYIAFYKNKVEIK